MESDITFALSIASCGLDKRRGNAGAAATDIATRDSRIFANIMFGGSIGCPQGSLRTCGPCRSTTGPQYVPVDQIIGIK